jgi:hypothetical protein
MFEQQKNELRKLFFLDLSLAKSFIILFISN